MIDGGVPKILTRRAQLRRKTVQVESRARSVSRGSLHIPVEEFLPTWSHMIICYSSVSGYASLRNTNRATWFGASLAQELAIRAHDTNLEKILRRVSYEVTEKVGRVGRQGKIVKMTPEIVTRGWVKAIL